MSCRVLKKGVEKFTLDHIVEIAKSHNCNTIKAEYIPTPKNSIVSNLCEILGFELKDTANNVKYYQLQNLKNFTIDYFIKEN